jgi:hypothetical protein
MGSLRLTNFHCHKRVLILFKGSIQNDDLQLFRNLMLQYARLGCSSAQKAACFSPILNSYSRTEPVQYYRNAGSFGNRHATIMILPNEKMCN